MSPGRTENTVYQRARAKYGFYKHLATYLGVNTVLLLINLATGAETLWSIWPMIGWGVAIVVHAGRVFVFDSREDEIIDRLAERERHHS